MTEQDNFSSSSTIVLPNGALLRKYSDAELALLDAEEVRQRNEIMAEVLQQMDLDDVAHGLTLDLADFERRAWNVLEPDTILSWGWWFEYLCEWLTLISSGEFKQRYPEKLGLIINIPPRSGKSTFATVNWPVWTWLKYPSRRFLFSSHSNGLAVQHHIKRRDLIRSAWFQNLFHDRFALVAESARSCRNNRTGEFQVTSIGSRSTGSGGDICVGDDLLDREDAWSEAEKTKTNHALDSSFSKLLNSKVTGCFVHISQRLAIDDPTGHLIGEDQADSPERQRLEAQWIRIKIKRQAEENEEYLFPLSGRVHSRRKGDILDRERCPDHVLIDLKSKSREWANQEQQEPTPATGALLNPNHLRWYRCSSPMPAFLMVVVSVDCNFAQGKDNDLVAIHKYALVYNRRYLLDRRTEQIGYIATKQAIKEVARGGHRVSWLSVPMPAATQVLIENKANGPAVSEELRADPDFGIGVIDYNPKGSKTQRFIAATGDAEAGLIYFPEDAPWIGALRKTLCDYAGEGSIPHDDDCDAWSQFINHSRQMQFGLLGYLEKQANEGREDIVRCEYVDENGETLLLEWDSAVELWRHAPTGKTYSPASASGAAEGDEAAAAQTGAAD